MDDNSTGQTSRPDATAAHTTVTGDDLRELLHSHGSDARLVLAEGRVTLVPDTDRAEHGLVIATKSDVLQRAGRDPDATALAELAELLTSEIRLQGA